MDLILTRPRILATLAVVAASASGSAVQLSFDHIGTETFEHDLGYQIQSSTYLSIPMDLAPGEMIFTEPKTTKLQMPEAKQGYAITGFKGEIVNGNNESAPLSQIYDHHWLALQYSHHNQLCPNGQPEYVVGIGAESRNTADHFPNGYGYLVQPHENEWATNIHLLHTVGLAGDTLVATKECNECFYAEGKGSECTPKANGTFDCCGEKCAAHECFCPTSAESDSMNTTRFYLRYQVNYTYDIDQIEPLDIGVVTAPDCELFYAVYENDDEPEQLTSTTYSVPADSEIIYAVGHQHTGALNISMFLNEEFVCASFPRYGTTPDKPGDEYGYLVEMSTCLSKDKGSSLKLKKGDKLRLDSWYWVGSKDERIYPHPGGTHLNVMAYMYMGYIHE